MTTSSERFYNTPEIKTKVETLKNYLWKFDKDMDDEISKTEMLNFFDSNMPNGKKYDRALADKIFNIFDTDKSGKISVDEFIKTFIHMEEELKKHKNSLILKQNEEKQAKEDVLLFLDKYSNEEINEEGLSKDANIECDVVDIDFGNKQSKSIFKIRISFGDVIEYTKPLVTENDSSITQVNSKFNL